jgi:hypothetical protein
VGEALGTLPGDAPDISPLVRVTLLRPGDDEDGDGLDNADELRKVTDLTRPDTDGDGISDGDEVHLYGSRPRSADGDADGLTDPDEIFVWGTNPTEADSDGDDLGGWGAPGFNDFEELRYRRTDPLDPDSDDDGLHDGEEAAWSTSPLNPDQDDDGHLDGAEVAAGTDPTDPFSPLPWPAVDTGASDTGLPACPEGEIVGCWGACTPDLRGDGDCNRWLDCPRYHADWEDCLTPEPPGCPAGTTLGCWGRCEPALQQGDGLCDEAFACPHRDWDGGDCASDPGPTLRAFIEVDEASDLERLVGVKHLDGVLRFVAGAPRDVVLPDLVTVGGLEFDTADMDRLSAPALTHVSGGIRLVHAYGYADTGLRALELPALVGVGQELLLQGPRPTSVQVPSLRHIGQQLTVDSVSSLQGLQLPELRSIGGGVLVAWSRGLGALDLPQVEDIGDGVTLHNSGLTALRAPRATRLEGELLIHDQGELQEVSLPLAQGVTDVTVVDAHALGLLDLSSVTTLGDVLMSYPTGGRRWSVPPPWTPTEVRLGALTRCDSLFLVLVGDVDLRSFLGLNESWRSIIVSASGLVDLSALTTLFVADLRGSDLRLSSLVEATSLGATSTGPLDAPLLRRADLLVVGVGAPTTLPALGEVLSLGVTATGDGLLDLPALHHIWGQSGGVLYRPGPRATGPGLVVRGDGGLALRAPLLTALETLTLEGAEVDLPALTDLGAGTWSCLEEEACEITLPALRRANQITVTWRTLPRYPDCRYGGCRQVDHHPPDVRALRLPALERLGRLVIEPESTLHTLELPALIEAQGLHVIGAAALESVDLRALERVGLMVGPPDPAWPDVGGAYLGGWAPPLPAGLNLEGGLPAALALPALTDASSLRLLGPRLTALSLPALRHADELLLGEGYTLEWMGTTTTRLTDPPSTAALVLELPVLESTGDLFLLHDRRISAVHLPALRYVGTRLRLHDLPALTTLTAPALTDAPGSWWLNLVHLPALQAVDLSGARALGRLALVDAGLRELSLPGLVTLGDHLTAYNNLTLRALRLPGLTSALELYFADNAALEVLELDALTQVDAAWISGQGALQALSLPALTTVTGALDVLDNPVLHTLDLPALESVGEAHVAGSPLLDMCAVARQIGGTGPVETEPACGI